MYMKKTLLVCALSLMAAVGSYAQSTVAFANDASSLIRLPGSATAAGVPIGSSYQVELMYAPSGTSAGEFDAIAVRLGAAVSFNPTPGRFNGGGRTAPTATPGSAGLYQVRAWETAFGSSYAAVFNGGQGNAGKSGILTIVGGNPLTTPPGSATSLVSAGFTGFNVAPVPEPSAIALGLVGAGALLMLRRRK